MTILIFIAILVILVLVHEFGHFAAAKLFGIKVEEFGIGFPPKLASFKRGETEYSLNALPLGGFVRIFGEEGEGKNNPRSYASRPARQRAVMLVAGVFFNLVFAFLLLWIGFSIGFPTVLGKEAVKGELVEQKVQIFEVAKGSPSQEAGIRRGDSIVKIQNPKSKIQKIINNVEEIQKFTNEHKGETLILSIKRGNEFLEKEVLARVNPPQGEGAIGVVLADVALVALPWGQAFLQALTLTAQSVWLIILGIFTLLKNLFITGKVIGDIAGPVGIAVMTGEVFTLGLPYLLSFIALISLNLGVINLLPIPALDGGRLLFVGIEKLRGSPLKQETENKIHAVGFALLIGLVVLVTIRDILQL